MEYKEYVEKVNALMVRVIDGLDEYFDEVIDGFTRHFRPEEDDDEIHTDCSWK